MLLVAVLGYIPAAFFITLVCLFLVKAGFAETRATYEKNTEFELGIYISSRSPFGCAPVELVCSLPDKDTGLFSNKKIFAAIAPFGKCRISALCMHRYRGSYTAKLERVAVYDPLRIIRLSKKVNAEMTQIFLPRRISLGGFDASASGELHSPLSRMISGEREDFSHVREYSDGDLIQLVHWKLTAKTNELMIKQYDENSEQRALVLCDFGFEGYPAGALMYADSVIETAISFAMASMEAGVTVTVDFGADNPGLVSRISDRAGFERFYELMSMIPAKLDVLPFAELIKSSANTAASVVFLVTAGMDEEILLAAEQLAAGFPGLVVLAHVDPAGTKPADSPEGSFLFIDLVGDTAKALSEFAGT